VKQFVNIHDGSAVDTFDRQTVELAIDEFEPGGAAMAALQGHIESRIVNATGLSDVESDGVLGVIHGGYPFWL